MNQHTDESRRLYREIQAAAERTEGVAPERFWGPACALCGHPARVHAPLGPSFLPCVDPACACENFEELPPAEAGW